MGGRVAGRRIVLGVTDLEVGGTPLVVRALARGLKGIGWDVTVVSLKPPGLVGDLIGTDGVPVEHVSARSVRQLPAAAIRLRRLLRRTEPDVVMTFLVHANALASLVAGRGRRGPRLVQSVQTTQPNPAWHWRLQARVARRADAMVVPSRAVADLLSRRQVAPPPAVHVIPNGVDRATLAASLRPARDASSPLRLGYLGRLDPVKNVPVLVRSVAGLDHVHLHVFGDGADGPQVARAAAGVGTVTLHGVATPDAVWPRVDALVLASSAEGFGMVLLEAAAAGVPVAASDIPGVREAFDPATALLFPPPPPGVETWGPLADAVRRLRDAPAAAARRAAAAHARVATQFVWDDLVGRYDRLLGTLL